MKVRIKFKKYGAMIYIGHLDVMRYFQKAIRRAEIDIAYSQGFNPHQVMSFAAPLGVGLYSNGEYLDIECVTVTTSKEMEARLNEVMVEGFEIVNVRALPDSAGNAMASVAAAEYEVCLRYDYSIDFDYAGQLDSFYKQNQIYVMKQTKKSEKELDIKPFIYDLTVSYEDTLDQEGKFVQKPVFKMMVDASSAGNIKPGLVMQAFYDFAGLRAKEFEWVVKRIDTYTNIGTVEAPEFISLDEVGEVIE